MPPTSTANRSGISSRTRTPHCTDGGELLTLRSAGYLPADEAHLLRKELQVILEGAAAADFGLHDVAHCLNMVSASVGVVLWAGPLTVHYEFATAFAA